MKILQLLTYIALFGSSVLALPQTSGAHFFTATSSVLGTGALQVCFDEAGVGNGGPDGNVDYTLTADVSALFGCINGGSNHPKASNKESFQSVTTAGGSFQPENGRVKACITTEVPTESSFTCPPGQEVELLTVSYTNVVLTDTTNSVSTSAPNAAGV